MPTRTKKVKSISFYKKQLDAVFSKFIRNRDNHTCYTCGLKMEPNRSQNGHFVPRQYTSVRYSEINCHCQCYACNMLYNGQPSRYAQRLKEDYGEGIIDILESDRHKVCKYDAIWYEEKINHYKQLIDDIHSKDF